MFGHNSLVLILEGVRVDGVYDGTHHAVPVLGDPLQQGLQPARRHLAVGVQEGQHRAHGRVCSQQPAPGANKVELQTKVKRRFAKISPSITKKAPTRTFSW